MRRSLLLSASIAVALHLWLFGAAKPSERAPRALAVRVLAPSPVVAAAAPEPIDAPLDEAAPRVEAPAAVASRATPRRASAQPALATVATTPSTREPAVRAGAERSEPLPTYSTALPPSFRWSYRLRRGAESGQALLTWRPDAGRYEALLSAALGARPVIDWSSRGGFDAAGVAPERFVLRYKNGAMHAANFVRAGRSAISYSGPRVENPLPAGAQDRLSWIVQLAAIVSAEPGRIGEDGRIDLYVSGARGDAARWSFVLVGHETIETSLGALRTLRLLREAQRPYDTRVEVWLDPLRHHLPVRATLATSSAGEELELLVQEML